MTYKYGMQPRFVVEISFKWKNAEHQIKVTRHLFDAATVPRPNLGADVVNDLLSGRSFSQCTGKSQIETRIINQHHRVGLALLNLVERLPELLSKITVFSDHFPQSKNCCVADPVFELPSGDFSHLRAATPSELNPAIGG